MNRIVIMLAVIFVLAGCEKKTEMASASGTGKALAKMSEFADAMCECRDKACADKVQERMTTWANNAAKEDWSKTKPDEATVKKMTEVGEKYAECMTKAYGPALEEPVPAAATPALPAAVAAPVTVEALLTSARTWARGEHKQLHVVQLDLSYVGADGVVDPAHGKVTLQISRMAQRADDPKRRTGAPVASQPTSCMELLWTAAGWTKQPLASCLEAAAPFPRCPVTTVWKRAIEKGAPADALAVLTLRESANRQWTFVINDELRKVAINHNIDDDCEVVVEKP